MFSYKNCKLEFDFDESRGQISSLKYCKKEFSFVNISVFEIGMRDETGILNRISVDAFEMKSIKMCESGFCCIYENAEMRVKVSADTDRSISWKISVENLSDRCIEWVNFPQIVVENDLKDNGGRSKILWGFNEGVVVDSIKHRNSLWGYIEPGYPSMGRMGIYPAIVELQCMAYYNDKCGLYFAAHDIEENLKGIDFYEYDNGIKLQFRHYTGCEFKEDYVMPYPMDMRFFEGDWTKAALIYRTWFEQNKGSDFVPIEYNDKLPKWYSEAPVIVTYPVRGKYDTDAMNPNKLFPYVNAMPHIERLEKLFNSKIMVILMHWEGTAPWAPPIVWPPYGGESELKKFIDMLHVRGDVIGVYCSGIGWTQKSRLVDYDMREVFEENGLKKYMCLSPAQDLPYSKICTDQRVGYDMCPTQKYTQSIVREQVNKMISADIDYIQLMDQNHGGASYFCYSRKHNHPPVPGKWQIDAVKKLLENVEKNSENVLFGCESAAAEAYIPQLLFNDNRYNLCYMIGEPVPLYSFVYHKYINNFMGNQVCAQFAFDHKKSPENIFIRIAYSFCCGDMLTVVIDEDGNMIFNWGYQDTENLPKQNDVAELIKNLNYWRQCEAKKYLHTGIMEIPYKVECDKVKIFGSYGFDHEYGCVFTSAWHSSDGDYGQFLVNHTDKNVECIVSLPDNDEFDIHTEYGKKSGRVTGKCKIKIDKLSALLIERKHASSN